MTSHLGAKKNLKVAISLMLAATFCFALQALFVKLISHDMNMNFLTFFRCFINFIVFFGWYLIWKKGRAWKALLHTKKWKLHVLRAATGITGVYCFYYGIDLLSISSATLLFFSFPLFVPLVARVWLKIELVHRLWWGIGLAFIGLMFILQPGRHTFDAWAFIPLLGALSIAVAVIAVRRLHYTDPTDRIMAYFFLSGTIVTGLVFVLTLNEFQHRLSLPILGMALVIGVLATFCQALITLAMKYAPARLLSPFFYLTFVFSALFDWLVFNQPLHLGVAIGFVFIMTGTSLVVAFYPKDDLIFKR